MTTAREFHHHSNLRKGSLVRYRAEFLCDHRSRHTSDTTQLVADAMMVGWVDTVRDSFVEVRWINLVDPDRPYKSAIVDRHSLEVVL